MELITHYQSREKFLAGEYDAGSPELPQGKLIDMQIATCDVCLRDVRGNANDCTCIAGVTEYVTLEDENG